MVLAVYDEETNLDYLQTRYYSPELCRFISADSVDYLDPESITVPGYDRRNFK